MPNALYHVRLVATNSAGTTFGPDVTFTTGKLPAPGSPTLGKTFNVSLVSGLVLVKINGAVHPADRAHADPEEHGDQRAPRHAVADQRGRRPVPGARCRREGQEAQPKPKTQKGTFSGAIFKLSQATAGAGKGLVTLAIVEGTRSRARRATRTCKKRTRRATLRRPASSRTLQLLHASAKGKFRTKGRYSAATVLGTKWTVADRCDGTLTHDITDSVAVNDFVHHKTIILHAGQSYLAKAPKHK